MLWAWIEKIAARWGGRRRAPGEVGERAAEQFLRQERGFRIVVRNWRHKRDELDLVCRDGDILVFVEVKMRAADALVGGFFAVDQRKKRALRRAVRAYLGALREKPRTFRFDIVEVHHRDGVPVEVRHFENSVLFSRGYHRET